MLLDSKQKYELKRTFQFTEPEITKTVPFHNNNNNNTPFVPGICKNSQYKYYKLMKLLCKMLSFNIVKKKAPLKKRKKK